MKILAILGTPRRHGNLARMLEITTDAARAAGHEVETVDLDSLGLAPCTGCMRCREAGRCLLPDDGAEAVRAALLACDAVILAAPVYFANVPGPVKTLFDRLSGAVMGESPKGLPQGRLSKKQKYLLLTACTTPPPFDRLAGQSRGALRAMREFFRTAGMSELGEIVYAGTRGKQGIPPRLEKRLTGFWRRGKARAAADGNLKSRERTK